MKKLVIAAATLALGMSAWTTQAATDSKNFSIDITLTAVCTVSTPANVAFTYTSNQGGVSTATGGAFTVTCTNGLGYSLGLFEGATPSGSGTPTLAPAADNVVNLSYTLGLSATSGTGSGAAQNFSVTGSMAASQPGTCVTAGGVCSNAAATNRTHTVILTY